MAGPEDFALAAAGGFPGEVNNGWRQKALNSFDCEYGFSCMGYEIAGGWGAAMALPDKDVTVFVGDGSYMMMNSDLYSSVVRRTWRQAPRSCRCRRCTGRFPSTRRRSTSREPGSRRAVR